MAFGDVEQPTWLHEPCPPWCARPHRERDHPDDRQHQNDAVIVSAVLFRWDGTGDLASEPAEIVVSVARPVHRGETQVFIGEAEGSEQFLRISLESAQRLSTALDNALSSIRAA